MTEITVRYHLDNGSWWAESPGLAGFSAAASSIEELRRLTHEGIEFRTGKKARSTCAMWVNDGPGIVLNPRGSETFALASRDSLAPEEGA